MRRFYHIHGIGQLFYLGSFGYRKFYVADLAKKGVEREGDGSSQVPNYCPP